MVMIDLSKLEIHSDESHVDENGEPRKDALIFEEYILCHPDHEEKLREAFRLFFPQQD